ncbi:heat shock factor protein isoform X2 [Bactrocera dorsalis]|uniref:Heat shock factor protein isoform X2 n=1 Tax=Bactrocera dorsalis TaxID=27457 RepID=A0A8N4L6Y2_BACDO|nr:heat shock factor protein isoform X2 [Bactrocera dorsalis]XP_029406930.2 heat shock factor protein isoform X2 [Bactrocera dorsalis]XP_029406931.2 heat shock factor protein isoform X2 [Bactrocera dorsalis]XP_049317786.1 heat shock factor protein isoform X2 [Bactrocera dorsalis]
MANARSKIDGKTKQLGIEKIFYDDTQEERTTVTNSSKNKLSATKLKASIGHLEADQVKQEFLEKEQMHTFSETGAGVPAFLAKLWRLVDDPDTNHLICWNKDGRSFIIQNQAQFARELLPLNYKHNNMASFIRQLNMYGFHKITSIDNGGLKFDRDEMEFSHPCFKRNCPYLLEHIKRKIANTKSLDDKSGLKPEAVTKVLQDVKAMRGRQDSLDSRFSVMKQENEALWREIASLRQKHAKQQQIVNKLIQFLITIVQPSRNMTSVKRHMQLMIHDTPDNAKLRKKSESESECGPVIHELGEELLDEVADPDIDLMDASSPYGKMIPNNDTEGNGSPLNIERPHSSVSQGSQHYDFSNQSTDDAVNTAGTGPTCSSGGRSNVNAINNMTSQKIGMESDSSIIQSVNPDGSQIFYHVTEVPDAIDAHNNDVMPDASPSYSDENVLTTPMVREQMARSQQLKQRNKRRRKQLYGDDEDSTDITASMSKIRNVEGKRQSPLLIKSEKEPQIDPMSFLNDFPDDHNTHASVAGNLKENLVANRSSSSLLNAGNISTAAISPVSTANKSPLLGQSTNFYNSNEFITSEMPADIFEESPLISAEPNSYNQQQQKQQQQIQYGRTTANSGKFSSFVARSNNSGNGAAVSNRASTSAAAAANQFSNDDRQSNINSITSQQGKTINNGNNMSLAKYKSGGTGNEGIMRDEVNDHLDNVQDELESLKDLLRSDGYSLDANTLLGLFNDSDILGPFGLNLVNEPNNEKKGSELMSYQPMYDLSDIIDINDKNELESVDQANRPSSSRQLPQLEQQQREPPSGLNTPYNDYFANALEPSSTPRKIESATLSDSKTKHPN